MFGLRHRPPDPHCLSQKTTPNDKQLPNQRFGLDIIFNLSSQMPSLI